MQFPLPQPFRNNLQMPHMLMWCLGEDDHVINIAPSKGQAREDLVYYSMKLNLYIF